MIPDAAFVLSLAGLNASFAGLGGLLVGLRRGSDLDPLEALRLRQVVEFAFANLLLAISLQPLALLLGDAAGGIRVASAATLIYVLSASAILQRRVSRVGIEWGRWWAASAIGLTVVAAVLAVVGMAAPTVGSYELLLVVMLSRPIAALVLVLGTIDDEIRRVQLRAGAPAGSRGGRGFRRDLAAAEGSARRLHPFRSAAAGRSGGSPAPHPADESLGRERRERPSPDPREALCPHRQQQPLP